MSTKIGDTILYSIKDLVKIFGTTSKTISGYFRTGKLKGKKFGGKWYVSEKNLKEFLEINNNK